MCLQTICQRGAWVWRRICRSIFSRWHIKFHFSYHCAAKNHANPQCVLTRTLSHVLFGIILDRSKGCNCNNYLVAIAAVQYTYIFFKKMHVWKVGRCGHKWCRFSKKLGSKRLIKHKTHVIIIHKRLCIAFCPK